MTQFSVLITGASGGIGSAFCKEFSDAGWNVIGTDHPEFVGGSHTQIDLPIDLNELALSDVLRKKFKDDVQQKCIDKPLKVLINNAAIQHLAPTDNLSLDVFHESFIVNTMAPFALIQSFLSDLESVNGCVLNIGSVHNQSTKPEFVAYATSKSAMHGMTRALAVDLGGRIRINTLAPSATATPMLLAGFDDNKEAMKDLERAHPINRIATPVEIAKAGLFLCSDNASFITGSTFYIDGGILSRLHDPL